MPLTLAFSILLGFLSAALFGFVGWVIHRRRVSPESRAARDAFVVWWATLSFISLTSALLLGAATLGLHDLAFVLTLSLALLALLCLGFWGLLSYLLFIYLNDNRFRLALSGFYFLLYVFLVYIILSRQPTGVVLTDWSVTLAYAQPAGAAASVVGLLFLLPIIVGAGAYLSLYRKMAEPWLRRRVLIVGTSILLWFLSSVPGSTSQELAQGEAWQVASRLIGLAATLAILYAYTGLKPKDATVPARLEQG
jgi:hypothetical protein